MDVEENRKEKEELTKKRNEISVKNAKDNYLHSVIKKFSVVSATVWPLNM